MATVFTHAFVGSLLTPLAPNGISRLRLGVCLALLAALPDLDVAGFAARIPYAHPLGHRGLSHSFFFAAVAGGLTALAFDRAGPAARRRRLALLFTAAVASHGIIDAFSDAGRGVGFLVPFSGARFFFPWRPVATSPIGVQAFFEGPALTILANELLWIWLPVAALAGALRLTRAARWRPGGPAR